MDSCGRVGWNVAKAPAAKVLSQPRDTRNGKRRFRGALIRKGSCLTYRRNVLGTFLTPFSFFQNRQSAQPVGPLASPGRVAPPRFQERCKKASNSLPFRSSTCPQLPGFECGHFPYLLFAECLASFCARATGQKPDILEKGSLQDGHPL